MAETHIGQSVLGLGGQLTKPGLDLFDGFVGASRVHIDGILGLGDVFLAKNLDLIYRMTVVIADGANGAEFFLERDTIFGDK